MTTPEQRYAFALMFGRDIDDPGPTEQPGVIADAELWDLSGGNLERYLDLQTAMVEQLGMHPYHGCFMTSEASEKVERARNWQYELVDRASDEARDFIL